MTAICILCEGKTEVNYIKAINRLLRDNDVHDLFFSPIDIGGNIKKNNYSSRLKNFKIKNLHSFNTFYAWIDFDIFKRAGINEHNIREEVSKIKKNKKPLNLLLNFMNGEDFFILNQSDEKIEEWKNICETENHFLEPMHNNKYLPLIKSLFPDYQKGDQEDLTIETLKKCISNSENTKVPFQSDITEILKMIVKKIES